MVKKADMNSRLVWMVLLIIHMCWCTHGFMCKIAELPQGLSYAGETVNVHGIAVGYSARFRCHGIYEESLTRLKCVKTHTWSSPSPPCKSIKCAAPPPVVDGRMEIRGWRVGDKVVISCREGFWYSGENPRICQRNRTWSGRDGQCQEVSCPSLDGLGEGDFHPGPPYKYKARLKALCNPGFVYNGSQELVCLTDNTWAGTVGQCLDMQLIRCQPIRQIANIILNPAEEGYRFQEEIAISCPEGYIYNGTARRTCQVDGSWSGHNGSCNVKTCPPYVPVGVGWVEPACSPCEYRDTVRVVCPQGYNYNGTQLTCDLHGTWTGVKKNCTAIPCDDAVVAGGSVIGSGFVYKDEANIRCDPGHTWVGDYPQAFCDSNGTWMINGNCSVLMDHQSASAGNKESTIAAAVCVPLVLVVLVIAGVFIYRRFFHKKTKYQRKSEEDIEQSIPLTDQIFKAAILRDGHVTNRDLDKRIDLDTQFITLHLVSGKDSRKMNDILPDRYQDRLQKSCGKNIEIKDLLNYVKVKKVKYGYHTSNKATFVKHRRPLLLEGRGGVGKSTLLQKLMRLWAQNEWATDYKAAFLFNIRSLTVVDKRQVSLVDFFKRFGVYVLRDNTEEFTLSTLREHEDKLIIFMDGVDEFSGLAQKLGRKRKDKIQRLSEPLTWCLDIIRRDVLGEAVLILASRPFRDLAAVKCDPVLEVVGLTREAILEFIDCHVGQDCETEEEKAATIERVKKAMTGNTLVMSVSAITYFCMLFCQVLEEDVNVALEELTTYTRIAAFFIQNYLSRNPSLPSAHVKPSTFLPQLAHLAYNGLVVNRVNDDIARLVFDKKHLEAVHLTKEQSIVAGDCGILLTYSITKHREEQSKSETDFTYEFVHLSVQELLAMMDLSNKDTDTLTQTAQMMWRSPSFNMAKMYLYGLHFDTESENIQKLMQMIHLKVEKHENDESIEDDRLIDIITMANNDKSAEVTSEDLLQSLQITYETQNEEVMKKVADRTFKESTELKLSKTLLTAIDMNAIIFMLNKTGNTYTLRLTEVTMDETCVEILSGYLKVDTHITELSLERTDLSSSSLRNIMESFGYQPHQKSLNLSRTGVDESSMSILVDKIRKAPCLTSLSLAGNKIGKSEPLSAFFNIIPETSITELDLSETGIVGSSIYILMDELQKAPCITKLSLRGLVDEDSVLDVTTAISSNTSLQSIDLGGKMLSAEKIEAVMGQMLENRSLTCMLLTGHSEKTNTLVCETHTRRRVWVKPGKLAISIYAWTPADIISSCVLNHDGVVWAGDELWLCLDDQFSSIYGEDRPAVSPDDWSQLLHGVTQCKHKVRELTFELSSSSPLTPLLNSITSNLGSLLCKNIEKVLILHGGATCCDLHNWHNKLMTQPGWSDRRTNDTDGRDGTSITNNQGQSVVIKLSKTRISSAHQNHRWILEQVPGLLSYSQWV